MSGQTNYYLERDSTEGTYGGYVLMNIGAIYKISPTVSVDLQLKKTSPIAITYTSGTPGRRPRLAAVGG